MQSRLLHNILLALAVIGLALFLVFKPEKAGPQKYRLSMQEASAVANITIEMPGRDTVVLEKQGQEWRMTAPFKARTDRYRIDSLLELLGALSEHKFPDKDLAKYELDKPLVRVSLGNQEFRFGGRQPVSNQIYVATGGQVYLVAPTYLLDATKGTGDFLAKQLLAPDEAPTGFALPGLKLSLNQGNWTREPDNGQFSADQLNRFVDEWKLATALSVDKANARPPVQRLRVQLANGKSIALSLVARDPELVLRREDEGLDYNFTREAGERLLSPGKPAAKAP